MSGIRGKHPMLPNSTAKGNVHRRGRHEKHLAKIQKIARRRNRYL